MSGLRIGVVGAGNMGADHATTLHRHVSGAEVTLVADIDKERAAVVAGTVPGARAVDDPYAAIADADVDAVVIASHDSTHADLCVAALRAGKPVLCEKPLAPTLDECVRVVQEERRAGEGMISLGFMRRFGHVHRPLCSRYGPFGAGAEVLGEFDRPRDDLVLRHDLVDRTVGECLPGRERLALKDGDQ